MGAVVTTDIKPEVMYNYIMERTQISLTAADRQILDAECARTGRSMSSLIRDAIHQVYGVDQDKERSLAAMKAAFGSWKDRDFTGAEYVESLRTGRRLTRLFGDVAEDHDD